MTRTVEVVRAEESAVRAALAAAVTERSRAGREAERLDGRAEMPGAVPDVVAAAERQRDLATRAGERVERLRGDLRRLEGELALLEAAADARATEGGER